MSILGINRDNFYVDMARGGMCHREQGVRIGTGPSGNDSKASHPSRCSLVERVKSWL